VTEEQSKNIEGHAPSKYGENNSTEKQVLWLQQRIAHCIEYVGTHRIRNQRKATLVKLTTILFSAIATILLGLRIAGLEVVFKDIAFVLTALTATLSAIEPYFNYRGLWVEHERAKYRFHRLQDQLNFEVEAQGVNEISNERMKWFNSEYQEIWTELSETRLQQRVNDQYKV
jgi:hypothetical protein